MLRPRAKPLQYCTAPLRRYRPDSHRPSATAATTESENKAPTIQMRRECGTDGTGGSADGFGTSTTGAGMPVWAVLPARGLFIYLPHSPYNRQEPVCVLDARQNVGRRTLSVLRRQTFADARADGRGFGERSRGTAVDIRTSENSRLCFPKAERTQIGPNAGTSLVLISMFFGSPRMATAVSGLSRCWEGEQGYA